MQPPSPARDHVVAITYAGLPRRLFTIQEKASGDLTFMPTYGAYQTMETGHKADLDAEILETHFSVHRSLESKTDINVLTSRVTTTTGVRVKGGHYTEALKDGKFAFLFAKRSQMPTTARHKFEPLKVKQVSLGEYDADHFQLIYQVWIAPKGKCPLIKGNPDLNRRIIHFTHFEVILFWQFILTGSNSSSQFFTAETIAPEALLQMEDGVIKRAYSDVAKGSTEPQLVDDVRVRMELTLQTYIKKILDDDPGSASDFGQMRQQTAFFKQGDKNHKAVKKFIEQIIATDPSLVARRL